MLHGSMGIVSAIALLGALAATTPAEGEPAQKEEAAQEDGNAVAKANNPLTAASAVNLQNYYSPSSFGSPDGSSNSLLVRGVVPFHLGLEQIVRATLPFSTATNLAGAEPATGLGDLNVFDVVLLTGQDAKFQFGLGPQLTFPTATPSVLGTGKWQIGAATVAMFQPSELMLLGALVTWQGSVGGDASRPNTSQLLIQPIAIFQIGAGFYLRSTASWTFDFVSGHYVVPLGVGAGKVIKAGRLAFNFFVEPQFSFLHSGVGQPTLQLLAGLNVQVF